MLKSPAEKGPGIDSKGSVPQCSEPFFHCHYSMTVEDASDPHLTVGRAPDKNPSLGFCMDFHAAQWFIASSLAASCWACVQLVGKNNG